MLLDNVPNWEGTPKLGSISYWACWAQSFLGKQVYYSKYYVFTSNLMCCMCLETWE